MMKAENSMNGRLSYDIKKIKDYDGENAIQRFYAYKTAKDNYDCDVSEFALEEARKIYLFCKDAHIEKQRGEQEKYEFCFGDGEVTWRGDTCNSFHSLYQSAVTKLDNYKYLCGTYGDVKEEYLVDLLAKYSGLSNDFQDALNQKKEGLGDLFTEFAEINHTLPNMMVLPKYLNFARYMNTKDNFSLFLYAVYQYLKNKEVSFLDDIFNHDLKFGKNIILGEKVIRIAVEFFDGFESWNSYLRENHFYSFCYDDGIPVEFFEGQSVKKRKTLPQKEEQFYTYLSKVTACIKARREEIINSGYSDKHR